MNDIAAVMTAAPVIAVVTIADADAAVPLAQALVAGGLPAVEVTLRTPAALEAVRRIAAAVPGAIVGAGTVVTPDQATAARDAGAAFLVSPGLTEPLAEHVARLGVPYLPGIATAGDLMRGQALGLTHFKFFPASTSGGVPALKALCAPFPHARFCPTGGVSEQSAPEWLALPSVLCVGGSWVAEGSPAEIEAKARAAAGLRGR